MGAIPSKNIQQLLEEAVTRAESCLGNFAVRSRYHKSLTLLDHYTLKGDVLGEGCNGCVYKAIGKENGESFAVKGFDLEGINRHKRTELESEFEMFLSMDHPHVARLVDVYQSKERLSLVMECMDGGELFDRVSAKKKYSENEAADATYQMLLAINYLHEQGIVHRDIKCENFMYEKDSSDHLKLIDFGFSKRWTESSAGMREPCGTLAYAAPELLTGDYTNKCDMWSVGVAVFILLTGYMPFGSCDERTLKKSIRDGRFVERKSFENLSPEATDFVRKLLHVDPTQRLSAKEALGHDFITSLSDRAIAAAADAKVDNSIVASLHEFTEASELRRSCLSATAWSLTNEDRIPFRSAFLAMSKTQRGTIGLSEFKAAVKEHMALEEVQLKRMFDTLATNSIDGIHYTEFLAAMVSSRVDLPGSVLKKAFQRFDVGREAAAPTAQSGKMSYPDFCACVKGDFLEVCPENSIGEEANQLPPRPDKSQLLETMDGHFSVMKIVRLLHNM